MLRYMEPERELSQSQHGQQHVLEYHACPNPRLACFPVRVPAHNTLIFFGSGLFWVTATAIKAITAKVERNPRISSIFLVHDIFGLVPVTRAKKACEYPSSPSYLNPKVFRHIPTVPYHSVASAFAHPCSQPLLHVFMWGFLEAELSAGALLICSHGLCHISVGCPVPSGDEGGLQDAAYG